MNVTERCEEGMRSHDAEARRNQSQGEVVTWRGAGSKPPDKEAPRDPSRFVELNQQEDPKPLYVEHATQKPTLKSEISLFSKTL